jgi:SAM-dependent methyltransferase
VAESFGTDAERYDRARPPYPDALIDRIIATAPGRDALDVGCGTGILARQLVTAGCTVLGIDPDARMTAYARRTGIDVEVATIEDWEPGGRTYDIVVSGQAWHWIDPVAGPAKVAQVLRPGGRLGLFWHVFEAPAPVSEALRTALRRVAPDSPVPPPDRSPLDLYRIMTERAADGIRATGAFEEPEQWRFDWERHYTRDQWLDLLPTTGGLTQLAPDQLNDVLAAVGAAIDDHGFTMASTTVATAARRLS